MLNVPDFHRLPHSTEFYFVRHGESESNAQGRIQGQSDSPLSDAGREHARAAGEWFVDRGIDAVFASPLSRAMETATTIARIAETPSPVEDPELMEIATGTFSDRRRDELHELDAELYREYRIHSWEVVPDAERIESLQQRAASVWGRLVEAAITGKRHILCVSHGGMIQWMLKATIGATTQRWMPIFPASNCGIFLFRAESTLRESDRDNPTSTHVPGTGYHGVWALVNKLPYRRSEQASSRR